MLASAIVTVIGGILIGLGFTVPEHYWGASSDAVGIMIYTGIAAMSFAGSLCVLSATYYWLTDPYKIRSCQFLVMFICWLGFVTGAALIIAAFWLNEDSGLLVDSDKMMAGICLAGFATIVFMFVVFDSYCFTPNGFESRPPNDFIMYNTGLPRPFNVRWARR